MKLLVKDGVSGVIELELHPWSYIKDVKDQLSDALHVPPPRQRLFHGGRELRNTHTLNDCRIQEGATIFLAPAFAADAPSSQLDLDLGLINVYGDVDCSPDMADCINAVRQGLSAGLAPRLAMEGTGGTYFLRSRGKTNVAVFKAEDEEPFAPANPRGYQGAMGAAGFRHGLVSGEGAVREVAAFLIDHDGFSGVPPTTRVEISTRAFSCPANGNIKRLSSGLSLFANPVNFTASLSSENIAALRKATSAASAYACPAPASSGGSRSLPALSPSIEAEQPRTKVGSLQAYVEYDELAGDVNPQSFPASEVHKIAILDIRLFNIDRNEANILVQRRYPQSTPALRAGDSTHHEDSRGSRGVLCSPPAVGPSHLHHHHSGFSPDQPFSFSPLASPVHSSRSYYDSPMFGSASATPTFTASTPLSPELSAMTLPPASNLSASFNLNYPHRAHSFGQNTDGSSRPSASIPIPIPSASSSSSTSAYHGHAPSEGVLLSSSVPTHPSRLQARLAALKSMRAQQAPIKPTIHLIPIDHSYTLPDTLELATVDWCWMDWPQAKQPLSAEMKAHVLALDVKRDIELLRTKLAIREECLKVMRISGMLLQKGVAADLTLYDIASLICRTTIDKPSHLEVLCAQATTLARGIKDNVKRRDSSSDSKKPRRSLVREAVKSVPTSPTAVTESDNSDNQDSPPQSAEFSSPSVTAHSSGVLVPSSNLSRMLQLNRTAQATAKEADECKVEEDDDDLPSSVVSPSTSFSHCSPPSIPDLSLSSPLEPLRATLPQAIPAGRPAGASLTRSNSLDLILRRSISYDDFRGVKVAKAGFPMASITTSSVQEHSDEEEGSEEGDSASSESQTQSHGSRFSSPPSSAHPQPKRSAGVEAYKADGVYHHAGAAERKSAWSSEEQSQLFFKCLSGLMDSAIERLKAHADQQRAQAQAEAQAQVQQLKDAAAAAQLKLTQQQSRISSTAQYPSKPQRTPFKQAAL